MKTSQLPWKWKNKRRQILYRFWTCFPCRKRFFISVARRKLFSFSDSCRIFLFPDAFIQPKAMSAHGCLEPVIAQHVWLVEIHSGAKKRPRTTVSWSFVALSLKKKVLGKYKGWCIYRQWSKLQHRAGSGNNRKASTAYTQAWGSSFFKP